MKIEINNQQTVAKVSLRRLRALAEFLMKQAAPLDPSRHWDILTLILTDSAGIQPVNRQTFGADTVTDVITLCYDPIPPGPATFSGEIYINVEQALDLGRRISRWSPQQELALYLAHGCDHLMNQSDVSRKQAARMRRRELRWLRSATRHRLIQTLLGKQKK